MRRKLLYVGLVILVLGVSITLVGTIRVQSFSIRSSQVVLYSQGVYTTNMINISTPSVLTIESSSKESALIPAYELGHVNSSNIGNYGVKPNASNGDINAYINITGAYYYVVFSNATPTVTYSIIPVNAAVYATLVFIGVVFSVVGVIAVILGLVLKQPSHNIRT
ncbi:MAG: hypothetical protein QW514_07830 [Thermoprotei archaeon]